MNDGGSSARESLLNAAHVALAQYPWSAVRMVDVAAQAEVSRQTLYNAFGGKPGLARALILREADAYLVGVDRALASHGDAIERLARTAEWTVSSARGNPLVRAMLTGCWNERLPSPAFSVVSSSSAVPAQRRLGHTLPTPAGFVVLVRDRAVAVLSSPSTPTSDTVELVHSCDVAVRIALSCITAPPGEDGVADLVRNALQHGAGVPRPQPTRPPAAAGLGRRPPAPRPQSPQERSSDHCLNRCAWNQQHRSFRTEENDMSRATAPTLVEQQVELFRELNAVLSRHDLGAAVRLLVVPGELDLGRDEVLVQEVDAVRRVVELRPRNLTDLRLGDVLHATQVLDPGDHALNRYGLEALGRSCLMHEGYHSYLSAE